LRQGNAQLDRVLKHATTCKYLQVNDVDLWKEALEESGQGSLGAQMDEELGLEPPLKKPKQGKLDLGSLRQTGQKNKEEQLQLYQNKVDHVIMRLICVRGLVPNIVDSDEWKELMNLLNGAYKPTSAAHLLPSIFRVRLSMFNKSRMTSCVLLTISRLHLMVTLPENFNQFTRHKQQHLLVKHTSLTPTKDLTSDTLHSGSQVSL
jgi:hypothetical protein